MARGLAALNRHTYRSGAVYSRQDVKSDLMPVNINKSQDSSPSPPPDVAAGFIPANTATAIYLPTQRSCRFYPPLGDRHTAHGNAERLSY
jgi:hypothetical protein